MANIPLNINSNAADVAKQLDAVSKALGLTTPQLKQMAAGWKANTAETEGFAGAVGNLTSKLGGITSAIKNVAAAFSVGLSFSKLEKAAASYNKTLFDLSRSTKVVGGDFKAMTKGIDELNKSTFMSKRQCAEFTLNLQKNVQGTRLSAQEVTKLGKILSSEYGGAIEDINKATSDLISLQKKNINVFKDLASGMSDEAFSDYVGTMEDVFGASEEQVDSLIKTREAFKKNGEQLNAQEKDLRSLTDSMQGLKKNADDLENSIGQQLANEFKTMNKFLADSIKWVEDLTNRFPMLTKLAAAAAVAIGGIAVAGTVLSAGKGVLNLGKSLFGGGKSPIGAGGGGGGGGGFLDKLTSGGQLGASSSNPMFVTMGKGGGLLEELKEKLGDKAGGGGGLLSKARGFINNPIAGSGAMNTAANFGLTKVLPALALGAAAKGAYDVLSDDKAYNSNLRGRKDDGVLASASRAINPSNWGKDIVTAGVLLKDATKDLLGFGDKIGGHKEVQAASKMSNKDFQAHLKKQQDQWAKDNPQQAAQVQAQITGQKAVAEVHAKALTSVEKERIARQDINRHLQMQKMLSETITQTYQAQIDYALKYENNVGKATELMEGQKSALVLQLNTTQKLLDITMKHKDTTLKELDADEKKAEALTDVKEREEALTRIAERREALAAKEGKLNQEIIGAKTQLRNLDMQRINALDQQRSIVDANVGLAESELQLSQQLNLGLGPTIESQMKIVDLMESQIGLIEQQIAESQKLIAEGKGSPEIQKKLLQLQQQKNQAVSKELELTKNLREGYLDAMGAFTNVEGAFSKVITKRESGMGEIIRQFGAQGGGKTGAGGAGMNSPMARWQAGGKLEFSGTDAMNQNANSYGIPGDIIRNRFNSAAATKSSGTESFFGAQAAGHPGTEGETQADIEKRVLNSGAKGGVGASGTAGPNGAVERMLAEIDKQKDETKKQTDVAKEGNEIAKQQLEMSKKQNVLGGIGNAAEIARGKKGEQEDPAIVAKNKAEQDILDAAEKTVRPGGRNQTPMFGTDKEIMARVKHNAGNAQRTLGDTARKDQEMVDTLKKQYALEKKATKNGEETGHMKVLEKQIAFSEKKAEDSKAAYEKGGGSIEQKVMDSVIKGAGTRGGITSDDPETKALIDSLGKLDNTVSKNTEATTKSTAYVDPETGKEPLFEASGGFIPGAGNKDSVPAMLMPGEFVMNKESSKKHGWLLSQLNQNKFADGGFVGGLASFPSAATAMAGGGGSSSFSPNISITAKGESVNKLTKMLTSQLSNQLNKMMTPSGSSGRFFDATQ